MSAAPVTLSACRLQQLLSPLCARNAVDLAGAVSLPAVLPHAPAWRDWIAEERHGGLSYLTRDPDQRADPSRDRPWARTALVFAQRYVAGWKPGDSAAAAGALSGRPWTEGVSRYARGRDYHDVLGAAVRDILGGLRDAMEHDLGKSARSLRAHASVDAGPYLEREMAWLAGLGFFGRNTCLIHPRLGSGFFLAVVLVEFAVPDLESAARPLVGPPARGELPFAGDGMASLCGNCTLCLDACPTGALVDPFVLDAGKCISTWSIEWRGGAPASDRESQGGLIFGCDICQAVCPWNHKALRLNEAAGNEAAGNDAAGNEAGLRDDAGIAAAYSVDPAHAGIDLADLISLDAAGFRDRFRRTPLWRAHPEGLRRNALVVAANTGRSELADRIEAASRGEDALSAEVAGWALERLAAGGGDRR